jgi:phage terminase large subunit GpA-like protein
LKVDLRLVETARGALRGVGPPPRLTISEWADRFRRLSPESSAEPGQWLTSRAEYQRGIMDAISDPRVPQVVVMSSAQVGKTEIINNVCGFFISQDPSPLLVVQPTLEMAETWSKDRLAPMLRDTPALKGRVANPRARDSGNTLLHKRFAGGHLTVVGANSPSGLASRPIRVVLADEVDRYPASAGSEGDPLSLAVKRTTTFWNRKVVVVSTPTVRGLSRIEAAWEASDQRLFEVPCHACGAAQHLAWRQVQWPTGRPAAARYVCAHCSAEWSDAQRWAAIRKGAWVSTNEGARAAGFHLSEMYSPWRRLGEMAADFEAAKDSPELLKTWVNTSLGETWQESAEAPEWRRLSERREEWDPAVVPAGALLLTAGVDRQADRLEVDVWGWGPGLESWAIDHRVIEGGVADESVWSRLTEFLSRTLPHELGGRIGIARAAVDTGGFDPSAVYDYARGQAGRVLAIKGEEGWRRGVLVSGPTRVDLRRDGRRVRRGAQLWTVATGPLKSEFYRQLRVPAPTLEERRDGGGFAAGFVHIAPWCDSEWLQQLTSEQLVTVRSRSGGSRAEWHKMRERNEALDCRIYARAAASTLGVDRMTDADWDALRSQLSVSDKARSVEAKAAERAKARAAFGALARK